MLEQPIPIYQHDLVLGSVRESAHFPKTVNHKSP